MMLARPIRTVALALALVAGAGAAPRAMGQDLPLPGDGFTWERVGDVPIDAFALAFGPDGTLWATGSRGVYRIDPADGLPGAWDHVTEDGSFSARGLLVLGRGADGDTLLATTGGGQGDTERSTDGGASWDEVYEHGKEGLYAIPAGLPHAGRVLTGSPLEIAYSDDRGATFTPSEIPYQDMSGPAGAAGFATLPADADHPGRVVAAASYGGTYSDDGGATFVESGLYERLVYGAERIGVVEASDGHGYRVVMGGYLNGQPDLRVWVSADEGETWGPTEQGLHLPEGEPFGVGGGFKAVLPLGGPSALAVLGRGTVYRTDDGGATWDAIGRAPEINDAIFLAAAALGLEGRLYVGLAEGGIERGWVWRTAEPVVVASEPVPAPPGALGLSVAPNPSRGAASVTFTLAQPETVRVAVYDLLGREVAVLVDGPRGAGPHEVAFDRTGLPAGVYVVRLEVEGAVASARFTVAR